MPLFRCRTCKTIENTALCRYWQEKMRDPNAEPECSLCDPNIGAWHDAFPRQPATGYVLASDGFLYLKANLDQHRDRFIIQGITIVEECA